MYHGIKMKVDDFMMLQLWEKLHVTYRTVKKVESSKCSNEIGEFHKSCNVEISPDT